MISSYRTASDDSAASGIMIAVDSDEINNLVVTMHHQCKDAANGDRGIFNHLHLSIS
jgi:hypothetical protein